MPFPPNPTRTLKPVSHSRGYLYPCMAFQEACAHHMGPSCRKNLAPCGHHMGPMRASYGAFLQEEPHVDIMWAPCGHHMGVMRAPSGPISQTPRSSPPRIKRMSWLSGYI